MKIIKVGLCGIVSLISGCSALLDGASAYSRTRDQYVVAKTAAGVARYYEENERARNTGLTGTEEMADALRSGRQNLYGGSSDGLTGNPLLWDLNDSDSNGKYVVFSKTINNKGEIFTMASDGSELRRLTFNSVIDTCPRWVGKDRNKIMWLREDDCVSIMCYDPSTYRLTNVGTLIDHLTPPKKREQMRAQIQGIFRNGYGQFENLVPDSR